MSDKTIIMHISDLHFGIEETLPGTWKYSSDIRQKFLDGFSEMIKRYPSWKPDILVVSGDIAWNGSEENYRTAKIFFEDFLRIEGNKITEKDVILCFGNHDVHTEPYIKVDAKTGAAVDIETKDLFLHRAEPDMNFNDYCSLELDVENRYHRFHNAEKFCMEMGFESLSSNPERGYKYAYGSRMNVKGIDFVCLNTEWDFWGKADKDTAKNRLRIGLKNYKEATYNFSNISFMLNTPARFAVYHRPLYELHKYEQFMEPSTHGDKCIENLINNNTDVSLIGHRHISGIYGDGAHTCIVAGAVY